MDKIKIITPTGIAFVEFEVGNDMLKSIAVAISKNTEHIFAHCRCNYNSLLHLYIYSNGKKVKTCVGSVIQNGVVTVTQGNQINNETRLYWECLEEKHRTQWIRR